MDLKEGDDVEAIVVDFSDAFKHLYVNSEERRYLAGTAELDGQQGYFVYKSLLFGVIPGPLLWGRVAAWLMRAAASLAPSDKTGLQCYVDDPILALTGTRPARKRQCARVLLLWSALNFKLAWSKASRGPKVEWIGAT